MRQFRVPVLIVFAVLMAVSAVMVAAPAVTHAAPAPGRLSPRPAIVHFPSRPTWYQIKRTHNSFGIFPAVLGSGNLTLHGGPVQHNPVTYVIFWGPGWSSDTTTSSIIENYFADLSGTSFENILTQYYDSTGNINNTESYASSHVWFDTSTPTTSSTSCGSAVTDSSLQSEVNRAISGGHFPSDSSNALYLVYTASGYYIYDGSSCNAPAPGGQWCAYHGWSSSSLAYGAMPYPGSGCQVSTTPNGSLSGDSEVNLTSHEEFETITDPQAGNGWYDSSGYEIGDKCAWDFSSGTTSLNNGGVFEVQTEYSNASSSCVNSYGTVSSAPTVSGFSPTSGAVGTSVTISGTNFTGATAVAFNGTAASYTVNSSTQITATVPSGATTGPISVTNSSGTGTSSSSFTVTTGSSAPTVSGFSPTSGAVGTSVTISGTNFTGATAVAFNGTAASYTVNSSTQITATVPSGATTGPISVTNSSGTGTSSSSFTVTSGNTAQLIVNGGFESGQSPWSESSSGGYQIIDPTNPHTGSYSAWLCGYNRCTDKIWQTVTIPSTMTSATWTFWLYIDTSEASGSPCYDHFYARIQTSGGSTITTPVSKCNSNANNGWTQYTVNVTSALSAYKGQSVRLAFIGTTDYSLPSDFFVDDTTFTVNY
jgi:hypothetical protein